MNICDFSRSRFLFNRGWKTETVSSKIVSISPGNYPISQYKSFSSIGNPETSHNGSPESTRHGALSSTTSLLINKFPDNSWNAESRRTSHHTDGHLPRPGDAVPDKRRERTRKSR